MPPGHDKDGVTAIPTRAAPLREFTPMQLVRVNNCYDNGVIKFVLGSIVKWRGPLRYLMRVGHTMRYCHVDHLRLDDGRDIR